MAERLPEVIEAAACAELRSEHPAGKAILAHAHETGTPPVEPDSFAHRPGKGVTATATADEILVGKRTLLATDRIQIPEDLEAHLPGGAIHAYVPATALSWE